MRARALGVVYILVATAFVDARGVVAVAQAPPPLRLLLVAVFALEIDALTPYFLWRFAARFPRIEGWTARPPVERLLRLALRVSIVAGALFVGANVVLHLADAVRPDAPLAALRGLSRERVGAYWAVQLLLSGAALGFIVHRAKHADDSERRRVGLLVAGLALGAAPVLAWLLAANIMPPFREMVPFRFAAWVIFPTLLSVPITTAYAVLVRQALDVRLVVRRALRYALARYTVIGFAAAPLLLLAALTVARRDASVAELTGSRPFLLLLAMSVAALALLRGQRGLLDRLDRRFFRRQYDARATLGALVDGCRSAVTRRELAYVLRTEIDRALQLESAEVLFLDASQRRFVAPDAPVPPLARESVIVRTLAAGGALTLDDDGTPREPTPDALAPDDRRWLTEAGVRLLLALRGPDRGVVGVVALGAKKSDLPFSGEDRLLLSAVTAAAELSRAVTRDGDADATDPDVEPDAPAAECTICGRLQQRPPDGSPAARCAGCGGPLGVAALPRRLGRWFRVEARVGAGGMGVVYRGTDLELGRPIALKTLPHVRPEASLRLRREARAMARVSHPNLASIYGTESHDGRPILVCEFLAGGTLVERLACGPMDAGETRRMGAVLADALEAIHRAGLLHRDVKPSNIGFTADGHPKLLDFGLARVLDIAAADLDATERPSGPGRRVPSTSDSTSLLVGTLPYMSPEAIAGERPDVSFDVWSLAVVLFEAHAGRHPFAALDGLFDRRRLLTGRADDLRAARADASARLATIFATALARRGADRYPTAAALAAALRAT